MVFQNYPDTVVGRRDTKAELARYISMHNVCNRVGLILYMPIKIEPFFIQNGWIIP